MDNIFEKISLTSILLKIFDIYFFCYLATNEKIAITHLWHAMGPQTMYHLIAKDKVGNRFTHQSEFQSSYYSAIQGATGLKL